MVWRKGQKALVVAEDGSEFKAGELIDLVDRCVAVGALSADPEAEVAIEEPSSERVTTAAGGFLGEHRQAGSVKLMLGSKVKEIRETEVGCGQGQQGEWN